MFVAAPGDVLMESDGASRCVSCSSSDADFPRGFTPYNTHCSASIIRGVAEIACACASACDIGSSYLSVAFLLYYKVIYLSIIIINTKNLKSFIIVKAHCSMTHLKQQKSLGFF